MEDIVNVSCGDIHAKLHKALFVCPGIHQECIELDTGQMITPKMMFIMGGKEKLKDWKNAIRLNGTIFRKLMDSGELEFHNHAQQCTGKCVSRHGGTSRYDTSKFEFENLDGEAVGPIVDMVSSLGTEHAYTVLREVTGESLSGSPPVSTRTRGKRGSTDHIPQTLVIKEEVTPAALDLASSDSNDVLISGMLKVTQSNGSLQELCIQPLGEATPQEATASNSSILSILQQGTRDTILEDEHSFWQGIFNVGLVDEFFREIKTSLDCLRNDLIRTRAGKNEARRISNIVRELGMEMKLKWKLAAHKSETEKQKHRLLMEIDALKKRVAESEERQQALKRKSDTFSQLMVGPNSKKRDVKDEY